VGLDDILLCRVSGFITQFFVRGEVAAFGCVSVLVFLNRSHSGPCWREQQRQLFRSGIMTGDIDRKLGAVGERMWVLVGKTCEAQLPQSQWRC